MSSVWWIAAAILTFGVGAAHSYLGERYILTRLFRRDNLPKLFGSDVFVRRTLRFAWHITTLAWWGLGAMLLGLELRVAAALVFALTSIAVLAGSRGRHLAWPVFAAISALVWFGAA